MNTVVQSTRDAHGVNEATSIHGAPPARGLPDIAGYHIIGELARGGMGRVLAGREERLDREVAIKVLLPGANEGRFLTEAKITARLPHPSIPPVYALGTLSDGSPFLAMKLVRGKTLADELKVRSDTLYDLPRFLQIFEQIAQAVGFAHSQHIIHRDLKPANVMVGAFGEVQVMDWGLAKDLSDTEAVYQRLREGEAPAEHKIDAATVAWEAETSNQQNDQTRTGAILGTPNYMAPEQARGEAVDVRADVFALGGILCAILTGKAVFGGTTVLETVQQAAAGDTADAQARLDASGADGEVVNLAKRCLAVMPSERPADGQAVAKLMASYRQGVEERLKQAETAKAEALVREGEQRKRRKILTWSAFAVALVLLLGTAISVWQAVRATDAEHETSLQLEETKKAQTETASQLKKTKEAEAKATNNLGYARRGIQILGDVFDGVDPSKHDTVGKLRNAFKKNLEKAVKRLDDSAIDDPLTIAELQNRLGLSLMGLGEYQQAKALFERCLTTTKLKLEPNHYETLTCMSNLAASHRALGNYVQALELQKEVLQLRKAKLGTKHPDTLSSMSNLATTYQDAGQPSLSIPLLAESLRLNTQLLGEDHQDTLLSMGNLAVGYDRVGRLDLAIPLFEKNLRLRKVRLGLNHPLTVISMAHLGLAYLDLNKISQAISLLEETVKLSKENLGENHSDTLVYMGYLARGYQDAKKFDQAIQLHKETLKMKKMVLGAEHPDTLASMHNMATAYHEDRKLDLALSLYDETLLLRKKCLPGGHPDTLMTMNNLAQCYQAASKPDKAIPLLEEALPLYRTMLTVTHPNTLLCMNNLGLAYRAAGKFDQAIKVFEETLKHRKATLGSDDPATLVTLGSLGRTYCDAKRGEEASIILKEYMAIQRKQSSSNPSQFTFFLTLFAKDLLKCNQFTTAEEMLREALSIDQKETPDKWTTYDIHSLLGATLLVQKKYAETELQLLQGYEGMKQREVTIPPGGKHRLAETLDRLIQLYTETNKPEELKKWQAEKDKLPREPAKK